MTRQGAGKYRTRITIQKSNIAQGTDGATKPSWSDDTPSAVVWSWWNVKGGSVSTSSQASQAQTVVVSRIRYRPGMDVSKSVVKDGVRWKVLAVDDLEERHKEIDLTLELIRGAL